MAKSLCTPIVYTKLYGINIQPRSYGRTGFGKIQDFFNKETKYIYNTEEKAMRAHRSQYKRTRQSVWSREFLAGKIRKLPYKKHEVLKRFQKRSLNFKRTHAIVKSGDETEKTSIFLKYIRVSSCIRFATQ